MTQSAPPAIQRTPEVAPFRPINRYRDPRVLARSVEPSQPVLQANLPLSRTESPAVLPQARMIAPMPLATKSNSAANVAVQRQMANVNEAMRVEAPAPGGVSAPAIQRSPEKSNGRTRPAEHRAIRVHAPLSRRAAAVRRSPLPLSKLRTSSSTPVVQRTQDDPVETYAGATLANSRRGTVQTQNLGGDNAEVTSRNGSANGLVTNVAPVESENGNARDAAPDLDRLARAILPVIKRMLAIERDRHNIRSIR
jgi:hypothetical protein